MTKLEMARVIVQALYRMPEAPAPDNPQVKRRARWPVTALQDAHIIARRVLPALREDLTLYDVENCHREIMSRAEASSARAAIAVVAGHYVRECRVQKWTIDDDSDTASAWISQTDVYTAYPARCRECGNTVINCMCERFV